MAKKLSMLLVIAGLLVIGLVGFLYFSPSGVTIEKFQDAPAESAFVPPVLEEPAFVPPVLEEPAFVPPVIEEPAFVPPVLEEPAPPPTRAGRVFEDPPSTPLPPLAPQAGPSAIQSMMPPPPPPPVLEVPVPAEEPIPQAFKQPRIAPAPTPAPTRAPMPAGFKLPVRLPTQSPQASQPIAAPTPIAPTPASSAAALTLTTAQCSALCPVSQETCESMFSCRTRLEPIGVTPMSRTSTPATLG